MLLLTAQRAVRYSEVIHLDEKRLTLTCDLSGFNGGPAFLCLTAGRPLSVGGLPTTCQTGLLPNSRPTSQTRVFRFPKSRLGWGMPCRGDPGPGRRFKSPEANRSQEQE